MLFVKNRRRERIKRASAAGVVIGGLFIVAITVAFLVLVAFLFVTGRVHAEERVSTVTVQQHLPYLLYNYSMQEALLPSTAELTPTTALTDGV